MRENCPTVPGTPTTNHELCEEIRDLNRQHYMQGVFSQYHGIIPVIRKKKNDQYFLITLDPIKRETTINGYKKEDSQRANAEYTRLETTLRKPSQVVLVQVSSVNALQRAYPNYFLDTQDFLRELSAITGVSI